MPLRFSTPHGFPSGEPNELYTFSASYFTGLPRSCFKTACCASYIATFLNGRETDFGLLLCIQPCQKLIEFSGSKQNQGRTIFSIDLEPFLAVAFFADFNVNRFNNLVKHLAAPVLLKVEKQRVAAYARFHPGLG